MVRYNSIIPIMTSDSQSGFSLTSTTVTSSRYSAFDGNLNTYYRSATSSTLPDYLTVTFPRTYKIGRYTISLGNTFADYVNMATWDFEGLFNGVWIVLHSGSHTQVKETLTFDFTPTDVDAIRIKCKSRFGTNSWGIDELVVYEYIPVNKILISSSDDSYKKYDVLSSNWQTVTNSTPTETDFINDGMDKSFVNTIPELAWSKLDGQYIKIVEYTDNPIQNESIVSINTEPFSFYDEIGDNFDVLYYTDDKNKTKADLEITHNYSPLDDLDGDFDIVTYIDNEDTIDMKANINALPFGQIVIDSRDIRLYGDLQKILANKLNDSLASGKMLFAISTDGGLSWKSYKNNSWKITSINSIDEILTNGMTISELNSIPTTELLNFKTIRFCYYLDEKANTHSQIKSIDTLQKASLNTPLINNASLYILNTVSTIELNLTGSVLDGIINDIDHGKVRYRVLLNDSPYYPSDGSFTAFESTPLNISIRINNESILMDKQNTLRVEIEDYWGESDYWETTFIGTYSGLIFKDSSGEYYSSEIGKILKYMDIGTLIAGQVSEEFEVHLYNTYGYDVENVMITPKTESTAVQIELSKQTEPFMAEQPLQWDLLRDGEGVVFYVRLSTQYTTPPSKNGKFELRVDATPVDTSL